MKKSPAILPDEIIRRIYVSNSANMGVVAYLLDDELLDINKARYIDSATDDRGYNYHLVRYSCSDGFNRLCAMQVDDVSEEDVIEWQASSCGMTYNTYIGKPWLDN